MLRSTSELMIMVSITWHHRAGGATTGGANKQENFEEESVGRGNA